MLEDTEYQTLIGQTWVHYGEQVYLEDEYQVTAKPEPTIATSGHTYSPQRERVRPNKCFSVPLSC